MKYNNIAKFSHVNKNKGVAAWGPLRTFARKCSTEISLEPRGGGGGYSSEFLVGVCRPGLQIPTLFQTLTCHFPHPFSDLAPVVQRLDNAIHRINHYPVDKC